MFSLQFHLMFSLNLHVLRNQLWENSAAKKRRDKKQTKNLGIKTKSRLCCYVFAIHKNTVSQINPYRADVRVLRQESA